MLAWYTGTGIHVELCLKHRVCQGFRAKVASMCKLARLYGASGMQACWPSARPAFPETTGRTWGVLLKALPRLQAGRCEHLLPSPEDHHLTPTSHEASPTPQTQQLHMPCHSAYSFPLQLLPPRGQGFRPAALTVGMGHATQAGHWKHSPMRAHPSTGVPPTLRPLASA